MATAPDGFDCPALLTTLVKDGSPVHAHDCPSCTGTGSRRHCEDCDGSGTVEGTEDECPFFADCEVVASVTLERAHAERVEAERAKAAPEAAS